MARYNQDKDTGTGWMPGFLRGLFGLERETPSEDRSYAGSRAEEDSGGLYWSPYERTGQPRRSAPAWESRPEPPMSMPPRRTVSRFQRPATTEAQSGSGNGENERREQMASYSRPTTAPAPESSSTTRVEGETQPIGYLLESYARGALPPQGLDEFLQQARTTFTQVGDFYQYWAQFQADSIGRMINDIRGSINPQANHTSRRGPQRVEVVRAPAATGATETPGGTGEPHVARYSSETAAQSPAPESPAAPPAPEPAPRPQPQRPESNVGPMDSSNKPWIERDE